MTNTDTGAMEFFSRDTSIFSAEGVMSAEEIREPSDVFEGKFLYQPITEDWAHESMRGMTPQSLLDGENAQFFNDMRTRIAFQTYLMRSIRETGKKTVGQGIIRHDILKRIHEHMGDINENAHSFMTYVMAQNIAYSAHYRNMNDQLAETDPTALKARVSHAELKLAYSSTGHDLEKKGSVILIKPGYDDVASVEVGRNVLLHNLEELGLQDTLPPCVQINIELKKPIETWEDYVEVLGRMRTKLAIIEQVFGDDVRVMTTYSYHQVIPTGEAGVSRTKQFFPLNANPSNRKIVVDPEMDIGNGITKPKDFDKVELRKRESAYTDQDIVSKM